MKRFTVFMLFVLSMTLFSCHKENETSVDHNATLIGFDLTLTACSGGIIVKMDNQTGFFQWDFASNDFGIDDNTSFPLKVKISYHSTNICSISEGWIVIDEMDY